MFFVVLVYLSFFPLNYEGSAKKGEENCPAGSCECFLNVGKPFIVPWEIHLSCQTQVAFSVFCLRNKFSAENHYYPKLQRTGYYFKNQTF